VEGLLYVGMISSGMERKKIFTKHRTYQNNPRKNKTPVLGNATTCFWCETKTGTYFGCFSRKAHVQPYHLKGLGESFALMWLNIGLRRKMTKIRTDF